MIEMIGLIYKNFNTKDKKNEIRRSWKQARNAKKGNKHEDEKSAFYSNNTVQKPLTPVSRPVTTTENTVIGEKISIEGNIRGEAVSCLWHVFKTEPNSELRSIG